MDERTAAYISAQLVDQDDAFEDSTVYVDFQHVPDKGRTSTQVTIAADSQFDKVLNERAMNAVIKYCQNLREYSRGYARYPNIGSDPCKLKLLQWQVLSYKETQRYDYHTDQLPEQFNQWMQREFSVVLYLQNAEEGGETCFPWKCYNPKPGEALIFPSNWCFPHYASEVTKGRKIAAVNWFELEPENKPKQPLDN